MNIVSICQRFIIIELALIIIVVLCSTYAIIKENKIIESKLDLNNHKLGILFEFLQKSLEQIICKQQLESKKQSPHLPINRDDIDDDGWRKP
ncbi:conserved protein of unknown function [Limnospira indica PCC 8005]|uniref:Uncharacterized protein n=1 Tax=Limnospira indica PCC 8005 TaxID=376219 RepID=A0A9P1KI02_9CYAN|nr:conserved protein of unknown function [Limnospira indica PCC 8005]CDM97402.1 conserved protein of unknown function [Limnospira indica PCC 8005]